MENGLSEPHAQLGAQQRRAVAEAMGNAVEVSKRLYMKYAGNGAVYSMLVNSA